MASNKEGWEESIIYKCRVCGFFTRSVPAFAHHLTEHPDQEDSENEAEQSEVQRLCCRCGLLVNLADHECQQLPEPIGEEVVLSPELMDYLERFLLAHQQIPDAVAGHIQFPEPVQHSVPAPMEQQVPEPMEDLALSNGRSGSLSWKIWLSPMEDLALSPGFLELLDTDANPWIDESMEIDLDNTLIELGSHRSVPLELPAMEPMHLQAAGPSFQLIQPQAPEAPVLEIQLPAQLPIVPDVPEPIVPPQHRLRCPYCTYSSPRSFNLRRHIGLKHKIHMKKKS